jgi:alpha-D-ribose 1-methylphosphonate 5-phosphate C-P lyase
VPPYTTVESLGFDDHPFEVQRWQSACELCGSHVSFLDEVIMDDQGKKCLSAQTATTAAKDR